MIYYGKEQFLRGTFHGREHCEGYFKRFDDNIYSGIFYKEMPMGVI